MTGPTSYYLPDGQMIFAYDTHAFSEPPWIIAKRGKRTSRGFDNGFKPLTRFRGEGLRRYRTEEEARVALHRYAGEHSLQVAY